MRWRILALLFAARVGLGFQFQTMGAVGGALTDAFGLDNAQLGMMIGLFMAPGLFLALPAGFSGRFASDRVLAGLGLGALALGSALSAMASGPAGIGFGRVLSGAGFLFATLYFTKMVADWFEGREIATAMSILVMSWPFGRAGRPHMAGRAPRLARALYRGGDLVCAGGPCHPDPLPPAAGPAVPRC